MSNPTTEAQLVEEILHRIASDLSLVIDRDLRMQDCDVRREHKRPAGRGQVHIAFRIAIEQLVGTRYGCFLLPLPEAISLANYLMMVPDDEVRERREDEDLDETTRDAILEVGGFIGGAAESALREALGVGPKVTLDGCQGVRQDVRPALAYREGDPLVVGRSRASIHDFPEFDLLLMLPELDEFGT